MNGIKPFEFGRRIASSQSEIGSFLTGTARNAAQPIGYANLAIRFGLAWGAIQSILYIVFADELLIGDSSNVIVSMAIPLLVSSIVLFICLKKYRDANAGYLNFQQGLLTGLIFGLSSAIVNVIVSYLYYYQINPDALHYLSQIQNYGFENDYSDMFREQFLTGLMTGIPFGAISGIIISLIPTFLLKNN